MKIDKDSLVYVAGHTGLVGSSLLRASRRAGFTNLISMSSDSLDLTESADVEYFFKYTQPDYVFLSAAKVGGILSNSKNPADFILDNLKIQTNVMESALKAKVKKLVFFGSSCIYPKLAPQPLKEDSLLTAPLEDTNFAYAIAKIAGVKTCEAITRQYGIPFITIMPPSLYGPNDNYDLTRSHVLPALIRRFHEGKIQESKKVTLWGTGESLRELLWVDDLADAALLCLEEYDDNSPINIGSSHEISVKNLAEIVREVVGYKGDIEWDTSMPSGTPRKLLDSTKITKLGWKPKISLEEGVPLAYRDFLNRCQL